MLRKLTDINFSKIALQLEPYYALVEQVNSGAFLNEKLISSQCSKLHAKQILLLEQQYAGLNMQRNCGNPFFIHLLRSYIWSRILAFPNTVRLLSLYHDFFEDFGEDFQVSLSLLNDLPKELIESIDALTNKYTSLARKLDAITTDKSASAVKKLILLKYGTISSLRPVVARLMEELAVLPNAINAIKHIERRSYVLYLKDLVETVKKLNSLDILSAKFIDRLDNVLSDYVQDFKRLKKLYKKNIYLFELATPLIKKSSNTKLKALYVILLERSLSQVRLAIDEFSSLRKDRGTFYGKQYEQSAEGLHIIEDELKQFIPFAEEFLAQKTVQNYLKKLQETA